MKQRTNDERIEIVKNVEKYRAEGKTIPEAIKAAGVSYNSYKDWAKKLKPSVIVHAADMAAKPETKQYKKKTTAGDAKCVIIVTSLSNLSEVLRGVSQ